MSIEGYDNATISYCQQHNITYESYGSMRGCPFTDPTVEAIATAHGASTAQVRARPRSSNTRQQLARPARTRCPLPLSHLLSPAHLASSPRCFIIGRTTGVHPLAAAEGGRDRGRCVTCGTSHRPLLPLPRPLSSQTHNRNGVGWGACSLTLGLSSSVFFFLLRDGQQRIRGRRLLAGESRRPHDVAVDRCRDGASRQTAVVSEPPSHRATRAHVVRDIAVYNTGGVTPPFFGITVCDTSILVSHTDM